MSLTAIERVLNLPELLEQILLQHVEGLEQDAALRRLFQLQCVARQFQDTITSSCRLKRLMLLAPSDQPDHLSNLPQHKPVLWFFKDLLGLKGRPVRLTRRLEHRINVQAMELDDDSRGYLRFPYNSVRGQDDLKASWRRMPVTSIEKALPLSVHFLVHIKPTVVGGHVRSFYAITWRLGSDDTLGDLYDRYLRVLDSVQEEHVESAAKYWGKAAQHRH